MIAGCTLYPVGGCTKMFAAPEVLQALKPCGNRHSPFSADTFSMGLVILELLGVSPRQLWQRDTNATEAAVKRSVIKHYKCPKVGLPHRPRIPHTQEGAWQCVGLCSDGNPRTGVMHAHHEEWFSASRGAVCHV